MSILLTDHFTLDEMTFSDTAIRLGIDNTAPPDIIEKLRYLAVNLENVRDITGALHINSGYRCPELNESVGSKPTSQHLKGEAADCRSLTGLSPLQLCRMVAASKIPFDQIIYEFKSWMHISFVAPPHTPRRALLTIDNTGQYNWLKE